MHELGIVFHIIEQVEEVCKQNNVKQCNKVVLEIGEVSTVVPKYLLDLWKWAVDNRSEHMHGCKLEVEEIKAVTFCENCSKTYPTVDFAKICPYCGSDHTYLLRGNEVNIKEIEVI